MATLMVLLCRAVYQAGRAFKRFRDVRFGSLTDILRPTGYVRCTPDSGLGSVSGELFACLPVEIRVCDGDRRCSATLRSNKILQFTRREIVSPYLPQTVRYRQVRISWMCIGNNHSTIMARRNRPEGARNGRILSRIVQGIVVALCVESPVKWASFGTHASPERKFAASLADRAGFEPAVAVTPRTLSKRVP
jgi:hypothetical protein